MPEADLRRKTDVAVPELFYGRLVTPHRPRLPVPPRADIALAAAFVVTIIAEAAASPDVSSPVRHALVGVPAMALLAWRRATPLTVAALVVAVNVLTNPQGEFSTLLSLVLVSFTVGSETRPPRSYVGLLLILVPFLGVSIAQDLEPSDLAAALVFFVGPWLVGGLLQSRIARTEEAVARAERLERDRELEAARAAAEERTRIARELHDIVSHSISVVTIQTQAVRRRLGPEHAAEAADLAAVEATARQALAEMRRLFGVLRTEGESVSPGPAARALPSSAGSSRRSAPATSGCVSASRATRSTCRQASTSRRTGSPRRA